MAYQPSRQDKQVRLNFGDQCRTSESNPGVFHLRFRVAADPGERPGEVCVEPFRV
jgi:hypothetical protein